MCIKQASPKPISLFVIPLIPFAVSYSLFLRYSLFDGEMSLWTLKAKYDLYLVEMQKYNKTAAKTSVLDSFLIHLLIGLPCKFAIFE